MTVAVRGGIADLEDLIALVDGRAEIVEEVTVDRDVVDPQDRALDAVIDDRDADVITLSSVTTRTRTETRWNGHVEDRLHARADDDERGPGQRRQVGGLVEGLDLDWDERPTPSEGRS